jgi:hypothetical protein
MHCVMRICTTFENGDGKSRTFAEQKQESEEDGFVCQDSVLSTFGHASISVNDLYEVEIYQDGKKDGVESEIGVSAS